MNAMKHVVCPGCTLLCDDIEIVESGSHPTAINACDRGQRYFENPLRSERKHFVHGEPAQLDAAVDAAVEILSQSKSPLVCGLDQMTTESQQASWKLADTLGATIDTTLSPGDRSSMFALQRVGKVTATIGEIANRSDLVIFWFCDPQTTHPRLLERLSRSSDHPPRRIIVVDQISNKTVEFADSFIQIDRERCPAVLSALRARIAQLQLNETHILETTGLELDVIEDLACALSQAKYGSFFFGQTTPDSTFDLGTNSLSQLVKQLNDMTRFVSMKLRTDANALSAENVLAWSSGYPFAVNHNLEYPRYNWLEFSANEMLARGQCDTILFATLAEAQQTFAKVEVTARDHLDSIPKIALAPFAGFPSDVAFQTGFPGLDESGEFCRNDDISIGLTNTYANGNFSATDILEKIAKRFDS